MKIYNVDGPDGVGKTTLVDGLTKYFTDCGKRVGFIHFPRYDTAIGTLIREALFIRTQMDPKSMQMLYSADRLNFTKFDIPVLSDVLDVLIVDRYMTSGIVYGRADGLCVDDLLVFDRETKKPNLNIILTAKPEILMNRMSKKEKDKYENFETQKKVLEYYKTLHIYFPKTVYINSENSIEQVLQDTITAINTLDV
jgi:dTMP kinase